MSELNELRCHTHGAFDRGCPYFTYNLVTDWERLQAEVKRLKVIEDVAKRLDNEDHYDLAGWAPIWDELYEALQETRNGS